MNGIFFMKFSYSRKIGGHLFNIALHWHLYHIVLLHLLLISVILAFSKESLAGCEDEWTTVGHPVFWVSPQSSLILSLLKLSDWGRGLHWLNYYPIYHKVSSFISHQGGDERQQIGVSHIDVSLALFSSSSKKINNISLGED